MGCSTSKTKDPREPTVGFAFGEEHDGPTPVGDGSDRRGSITPPLCTPTIRRRESGGYGLGAHFTDDDIKRKLQHTTPIYRVVLTGGPCAGKSTLLSLIQTKFAQRTGIKVYCVPEAATLLVGGGLEWTNMTDEKIVEYQLALLRVQLALEDQLYAIARVNNLPSLIVSDRGTMDGRAYCTPEQFSEILRRGGWDMETLRDERYDAIVHMVSAAIGAEHYYNFDNPARFENVDEAAVADEKLRQMYVGHPLLRVFDNSTNFENKLERVMQFIGNLIGHEFPHNMIRRFVLSRPPLESEITVPFVRARVTITILHNSKDDEVMQVMKREQDKASVYFYTCIKRSDTAESSSAPKPADAADADKLLDDDAVTKREHRISAREYASLLHQRDPNRVDVVKDNISFMFQSHYCEVATFVSPPWTVGNATLYVDCEDTKARLELPEFLEVNHERRDGWASSFQISLSREQSPMTEGSVKPVEGVEPSFK